MNDNERISQHTHHFNRIMQHLNAIIAASSEEFTNIEESNYYRIKAKEAALTALCYIPEVNNLGNDRERNKI